MSDCHNCNWSQDDFWSEDGYNPLDEDSIGRLRKDLFEKEPMKMDSAWVERYNIPHDDGYVMPKDLVVSELERKIKSIKNMKWFSNEDWKNDKDAVCPNCGKKAWDID